MLIRPLVRSLIRTPLERGNSGGVDADAAAWALAVTAAGGTYSASTLGAVSTFAKAAKASNYWTKLNRINLFAGGGGTAAQNFAGCLVPLKVGGGSATETNVNFVAGDYTEATGLTGNATSKYLNTGLVPSASLTLNSTHLAVYHRSSTLPVGATVIHIGAIDGTGRLNLDAPYSDGNAYSEQYGTGGGRVSGALAAPYGFVVASRTAAGAHAIYRNGTSIASNATSEGALPAFAVNVFAANISGAASGYVAGPLSAYSIGSGLSAADVTAYDTHMQAFQLALGRNV